MHFAVSLSFASVSFLRFQTAIIPNLRSLIFHKTFAALGLVSSTYLPRKVWTALDTHYISTDAAFDQTYRTHCIKIKAIVIVSVYRPANDRLMW